MWLESKYNSGDQSELWDIRAKSGRSHKVQYYYGCYDPLQYVLMFPNGEPGRHNNIVKLKNEKLRDVRERRLVAESIMYINYKIVLMINHTS
ncbi:hypothetical protein LIER_23634 [Lithospermum erythrorhizon]|uniref:Uncharacterized protein n=1 Tax=Lithospermum erythrorhizon TaxID=34254 RepID=A0AAV3R3X6_LITER